jgi:hypothetical protein
MKILSIAHHMVASLTHRDKRGGVAHSAFPKPVKPAMRKQQQGLKRPYQIPRFKAPQLGILLTFAHRRNHLVQRATLAIYYSNLPSAGLRVAAVVSFAVLAIWVLWLSRDRRVAVALRRRGVVKLEPDSI